MKRNGSRILRAATALWLVVVSSCGRAPMAPQPESAGGANVAAPESEGGLQAMPRTIQPPVLEPTPDDGTLETSETFDGSTGGTLALSDIQIRVPKDAFSGEAEIKMTVPDSEKLEVHLEIYPASKNDFAKPVRLEFDARANGQDVRVMQIMWFDPAQNAWVVIPSQIDTQSGKVFADLPHFSMYKACSEVQGRAGW